MVLGRHCVGTMTMKATPMTTTTTTTTTTMMMMMIMMNSNRRGCAKKIERTKSIPHLTLPADREVSVDAGGWCLGI